ncbi:nuclear transport factor 2 family protein [Microlunatus parietis]|uniref:SnoaL-like domain-containing protein n=1 Tax=Microlunatus parietis TaxID=682979 RepID=A0A7Y9I4B9_9ACTN|nr:nuclear transport factor 2 family protein [Microlunatus parietis]NYE69801.1 hypothetical protein [Microlunatus parietis]
MTPKEIYLRQLELAIAGDRDAQAAYYAPDAVVHFPFAPEGVPDRFDGRDAIRSMSVALDRVRGDAAPIPAESNLTVHETTDPEVIIAELDAVAVDPASGRRQRVRQLHVVRVRDELIIEHRDYFAGASAELVRQALATPSAP